MPMTRFSLVALALCLGACQVSEQTGDAVQNTPGGATTILDATSNAFSTPAPNLQGTALELHLKGDAAFEATFVTAPAPVNGGLGPVFNNSSCVACHARDGRGKPPAPGESMTSILFRLSLPGQDDHGGPLPVPGFGAQLQPRAVFGKEPEAQMEFAYRDSAIILSDGGRRTLQVPSYQVATPYQPLPVSVRYSPRVAPPVFGLGLLEAVEESSILALADEGDLDRDGISGKANYVFDVLKGVKALGRFGWKSNTPNLLQQSAAAYNNDMGITSWVFPRETCFGQTQGCDSSKVEVDSATLAAVTLYVRTLAVPARRNTEDGEVEKGEKLFHTLRCIACHVPELRTGDFEGLPEISRQTINPYTDLLLHDMGRGLEDGRPDFEAGEREWRTPPLWGIGLTEVVNGHSRFLHDGRARSLEEAILWHGGEGEGAREAYKNLTNPDRESVLRFLESL